MAKHAEFTSNFDDYKQILEFKKDFKHNIINTGLDKPLKATLEQLRTDLKFVVNEKIRVIPDDQRQTTVSDETALGQPYINPPKSEDEILRYLTDGKTDLSKYNKAKDYTTLGESNVVFGHRSTGQDGANRVTLRLEIGPDETVDQQYQKARTFFQDAIFAMPDGSGKTAYYMNPGVDISQYLKIKCSVFTGDGDIEPLQGMSPKTRFEKDRNSKGYAQWTLQQEGVNKIRNSYLNLTQVVDLIKEGDYETAKKVLLNQARRVKVRETTKILELSDRLTKLQENKASLPLSTQSYTNALELINNLAISKKVTEDTVTYSLVSTYADFANQEVDFNEHIQSTIRSWVTINEDEWFNSLVESTERLIKYYTSTFTSSVES